MAWNENTKNLFKSTLLNLVGIYDRLKVWYKNKDVKGFIHEFKRP